MLMLMFSKKAEIDITHTNRKPSIEQLSVGTIDKISEMQVF